MEVNMDVSALGGGAALQAAQAGNEIGIEMLKESQEMGKNQLDLINALPEQGGKVGNDGVDVKA